MTGKQKRNYNKSEAKDKHGENEEAIGKEPAQPSFLVYKSIPERGKEKCSVKFFTKCIQLR